MLVKNWMKHEVVTVTGDSTLLDAAKMFSKHRNAMIPVLMKGVVAGVLFPTDLDRALGLEGCSLQIPDVVGALQCRTVSEVVGKAFVSILIDATVEEAATILMEKDVVAAPVVDPDGRVQGSIHQEDILRAFLTLSGAGDNVIQLGLKVEDRPGAIRDVVDMLGESGCRLMSVLSTLHEPSGYRHVFIRACDCERQRIEKTIQTLKGMLEVLYIVDHDQQEKSFFEGHEGSAAEWFVG